MQKECSICFEESVDLVALPCQHEVCPCCHVRLVELNNRCPFCQAVLQNPPVVPLYIVERYEFAADQLRRYDQFVCCMILTLAFSMICCILFMIMRNPKF
jgi:hypothetical protein